MKKWNLWAMVFVLSAILCLVASGAAYSAGGMVDLGTLGGNFSWAFGINDKDEVVGYSTTASGQTHAFLYSDGRMTDLGTLGGAESRAYGINVQSDIVGYSTTASGQTHAFLYSRGTMKDLGTVGGTWSQAYSITDDGVIVGCSTAADGADHGFLWNSSMGDLGPTHTDDSALAVATRAYAVAGFSIAGALHLPNGWRAARHTPDGWKSLGVIPGGDFSEAYAISPHYTIVGASNTTPGGPLHAVLFGNITGDLPPTKTDLGTLGGKISYANGINDHETIVGESTNASGNTRAFSYDPPTGKMIDLGDLGGTTSRAWAINYPGHIVGSSTTPSGQTHAFGIGVPPPLTLNQALDNNKLAFTKSGDAKWFPTYTASYYGGSAAQSGAITHGQVSTLQTTLVGPGTLSYYFKVSSEPGHAFLALYANGTRFYESTGTIEWSRIDIIIPADTYTFQWQYEKPGSLTTGSDCAWIDKVVFTRSGGISLILPLLLGSD
jgi:probable HAF family extracellular repeat protein